MRGPSLATEARFTSGSCSRRGRHDKLRGLEMPGRRQREGGQLAIGGAQLVGEDLRVPRGDGTFVQEHATGRYTEYCTLAAAASTSGVPSGGWKMWSIKASTRQAAPVRIAGSCTCALFGNARGEMAAW